ncbi:hypothetical protein PUN28_001073 [Cardiocondyla obscurior]|uniref:Uncharacterized protein n=1 Tax=Cardiocondyla obscurior TaxID=286306 RepID=A0AAW2H3D8_9HYME
MRASSSHSSAYARLSRRPRVYLTLPLFPNPPYPPPPPSPPNSPPTFLCSSIARSPYCSIFSPPSPLSFSSFAPSAITREAAVLVARNLDSAATRPPLRAPPAPFSTTKHHTDDRRCCLKEPTTPGKSR